MPFRETEKFSSSEYNFNDNYELKLNDIPVISQQTSYTCGATSLAIVKNKLGYESSEQSILNELDLLESTSGMLPNKYLENANKIFNPINYNVILKNTKSDSETLNIISSSLENKLPVAAMISTQDDWDKPNFNTHYVVVYGIDMKNKVVNISNPYGYLEELSFEKFFDGLDFSNYEMQPLEFKLARKVGIIKTNNLFLLKQTNK